MPLKVISDASNLAAEIDAARKSGKSIGFVPTMGALHDGHLSLVSHSVKDNDITVVSVYVNPTQFNNPEDLEKYPRNDQRDIEMLSATRCDIVFLPTDGVMYPDGKEILHIELDGIDRKLEGEFRPGHFDGVVTIVNRLFEMVHPRRAYFGEKDFQQVIVVRKLAALLHPELEIVSVPIMREESGLAMSSRNARMSSEEKELSLILISALKQVKDNADGMSYIELEELGARVVTSKKEVKLEYFRVVDPNTLEAPVSPTNKGLRAFVAAEVGPVRLIDNLAL